MLPNERDPARPTSPVKIAAAPTPTIAAMWQEALRRNGIVAMLRSHDVGGTIYGAPPLPFATELLVAAEHEDAARQILDDLGATEDE